VHADFRFLDGNLIYEIFPQEWQRQYTAIHVYVRDIILLLLPIAFFIVWVLKKIAYEAAVKESA
jgi:hypothetical protein